MSNHVRNAVNTLVTTQVCEAAWRAWYKVDDVSTLTGLSEDTKQRWKHAITAAIMQQLLERTQVDVAQAGKSVMQIADDMLTDTVCLAARRVWCDDDAEEFPDEDIKELWRRTIKAAMLETVCWKVLRNSDVPFPGTEASESWRQSTKIAMLKTMYDDCYKNKSINHGKRRTRTRQRKA